MPKGAVKALSRAEAAQIYRAQYWNPCKAGAMPAGVDLAVFDFAVNSGPDRAVRVLQAAAGVAADGEVGPKTLAAIGSANQQTLINTLCDRRLAFLRGLATFPVFGRGWTDRVKSVRAAALAAVRASNSMQRRLPMSVF